MSRISKSKKMTNLFRASFNDYIETDFTVETLYENSGRSDDTNYLLRSKLTMIDHAIDERYNDHDTTALNAHRMAYRHARLCA